jgi:hypothetical protein
MTCLSDPDDAHADIRTLLFMYKSILDFAGADRAIRITPAAARTFDLPARSVHASFLVRDLSRRRMLKTIATLRESYGIRAAASMNAKERSCADDIDRLLERFQRSIRPPISWWKLALPLALLTTFVFRLLSIRSDRDRASYEALLDSIASSLRLDYQAALHPATPITGHASVQLAFNLAASLLIVVLPFMWRSYPFYRALFLVDWVRVITARTTSTESHQRFLHRERCASALELRASAAVGSPTRTWWDFQLDLILKFAGVTTVFAFLLYFWTGAGDIPLSSRLAFAGAFLLFVGPFWWWYVVRVRERMVGRHENEPIALPRFLASLSHSRSLTVWCLVAFALLLSAELRRGQLSIFDPIGLAAICVTWVSILRGAAWVTDAGWLRLRAWIRGA